MLLNGNELDNQIVLIVSVLGPTSARTDVSSSKFGKEAYRASKTGWKQSCLEDTGWGVGACLCVACPSHLTIDHALFSRRSTIPTPDRVTLDIWALITSPPYTTQKPFYTSYHLPVSPFVATIFFSPLGLYLIHGTISCHLRFLLTCPPDVSHSSSCIVHILQPCDFFSLPPCHRSNSLHLLSSPPDVALSTFSRGLLVHEEMFLP